MNIYSTNVHIVYVLYIMYIPETHCAFGHTSNVLPNFTGPGFDWTGEAVS